MSSPRLQAHMVHDGVSEHDVVRTDSEASHACKGVMFLMEAFLSTFWTLSLALQTRMTDARFCEVDRPKKDTHTSIELSCSSSSVTDMADVVLENPAEACTECGGEGGRIQAPCECVPSRNDLLI